LARSDAPTPARAEALNGAGAQARNQADYEQAQRWLEESLVLRLGELGDKKGTAQVLIKLGTTVAFDRGEHPQSTTLQHESLSLWRELGDRWGVALAQQPGDSDARPGRLGRSSVPAPGDPGSFSRARRRGDIALVLSNLGGVAEGRGEYARAASFYRESLDLYREVGERRGIALLTGRLGGISQVRTDYARAAALYDESLRLHRELGSRLGIPQDLEGIATIHVARGSPESAVRLRAAVEALREEIGASPKDPERARYEPLVAKARDVLGEEGLRESVGRGPETPA
jgi:tetratricopeptide (TPR) repeat protein